MKDHIHKFVEKVSKGKKPFAQIALELGIDIPEGELVMRKCKSKRRSIILRWAGISASVLLMITGIVLGILLPNAEVPPNGEGQPITFSAYDSVSQDISLDYLYSIENLLLLNKEQILNADDDLDVFRHVVREGLDEAGLLLSYTVHQLLFLTQDEENAFLIDYNVRMYRYYEFFGYADFNDLTQSFMVNQVNVYYQIFDGSIALVRFAYRDLDYFLYIECFFEEGVTIESLTNLLNELFAD